MAILNVGPNSTFPTIALAMANAGVNDTIVLESGYRNETAFVTHVGMTVSGDATSTGIVLKLGTGITTFTLAGAAPITVLDAVGGNAIVGNDGNNLITVSGGADSVSGGLGTDRLTVDYRLTSGAVTGDSTSNFTDAGGLGSVTILGGFEHFTVMTGSGADTITTGAGDDIILTGEGAGTVTAGQGANVIVGGNDADTITALDGGNYIHGRNGTNNLTSGNGNDTIIGGTGADTITAGGGDDLITVRGGSDTVTGGAGSDRLTIDYAHLTTAVVGSVTGGNLSTGYTGHFEDTAGSQVDFVATENLTIETGRGNDSLRTGDGADILSTGAGADRLVTSGGADVLDAGSGNDILLAGDGHDTLDGGAGIDAMGGGDGHDRMFGGDDNDRLTGGLGRDIMEGGGGRDRFIFTSMDDSGTTASTRDQIRDFVEGSDIIDLSGIDARLGGRDNAFDFLERGGFTGAGGEVRVHESGAHTMVAIDFDGDKTVDFQIILTGRHTLDAGDFLL